MDKATQEKFFTKQLDKFTRRLFCVKQSGTVRIFQEERVIISDRK